MHELFCDMSMTPRSTAIFHLVMSPVFDNLILLLIVANVASLLMTHDNMSEEWNLAMTYCNVAFTAVFTLEAVLKLVALGLPRYVAVWFAWR
jgi:hypothetical protein